MKDELPIINRKIRPSYDDMVVFDGKTRRVKDIMFSCGSANYFVLLNAGEKAIVQTNDADPSERISKKEYVMITKKTLCNGIYAGKHVLYDWRDLDSANKILSTNIHFSKVSRIWNAFYMGENDLSVYYIIIK